MRDLAVATTLIIWFLLTIVLTFSLVGMFLFIPGGYHNDRPTTWMTIGRSLTIKLIHGDDVNTKR